jgi:hypothetical protein
MLSDGRGRPSHNPIPLLLLGCTLLLLGCGADQSTRPAEPQAEGDVQGAVVPETAEEGSQLAIEIWGKFPDGNWVLDRFDACGGSIS